MEEKPQTRASPEVVQAPDDVGDLQAVDPRHGRAAPAGTIAGVWIFIALVGMWLLISPTALGYSPGDSRVNTYVCGALAIAVGVMGVMRMELQLLGRITVVIGLWVIASAWFLVDSSAPRINMILMGGILVVLSLVGMSALSDRHRARDSIT